MIGLELAHLKHIILIIAEKFVIIYYSFSHNPVYDSKEHLKT
jgi:hypothetical protein